VLVVEDDRATSSALRVLLARKGWEVQVAASLADAMAAIDSAPDVVILDLMLPDGNGEAVLERARQSKLPSRIIVTTGASDQNRLAAVQRLGPDALLMKPIDFQELYRHLALID
jgi:two-component system, response regulator RegA